MVFVGWVLYCYLWQTFWCSGIYSILNVRFTLELTLDFSLIKLPKIPTPEKGKYFVGSPNFSPSGERGGGDIPIAPISSFKPTKGSNILCKKCTNLFEDPKSKVNLTLNKKRLFPLSLYWSKKTLSRTGIHVFIQSGDVLVTILLTIVRK